MIEIYERYHASVVAIMEVPKDEVSRYGIVNGEALPGDEGRVFKLKGLVEKPRKETSPSNLAIIGRYILTPAIFGALQKTPRGAGGEIQLTDGLQTLLESEPVYAYRFRGTRYDAGEKFGFLKTTVELALRNEELGSQFREYLRSLDLENFR
jgi:UTP--glucose-1-phosphate uridylyltransferase